VVVPGLLLLRWSTVFVLGEVEYNAPWHSRILSFLDWVAILENLVHS
jgi:hypothetical protein